MSIHQTVLLFDATCVYPMNLSVPVTGQGQLEANGSKVNIKFCRLQDIWWSGRLLIGRRE